MAGTRDPLDSLPPWDAAGYFQTTTEVNFQTASNGQQLIGADPNRVALIFGTTSTGSSFVTTTPTPTNLRGIQVAASIPPLMLLFKDVGPLVQQAWYLLSTGFGINISVYAVSLYRWPQIKAPGRGDERARTTKPVQRNRDDG